MTIPFIIRQATEDDTSDLTALAVSTYTIAFDDSFTPQELTIQLERNLSEERIEAYITQDVVLVAEHDRHIIGYIHLSDISFEVDTPVDASKSLRRLYVHPDYQGQGIGSALIQAAMEHDFLKDTRYIYLDVWEKNLAAIRFYERHGFKRVDAIRYIYADGTEGDLDIIMRYDRDQ